MGASQKLATVVMIGLVALSTVILAYIVNEPNRRDDTTARQEDLAIERGTSLYITYCLQCHGPTGKGAAEGTGRIGGVINQEGMDTTGLPVVYQSDDPAAQTKAEQFLYYRIENGAPGDPRLPVVMPAFGTELNVEQINDLVALIMNGDWDEVYHESVTMTGATYQAQTCAENPDDPICSVEDPEVEPTVPPTAAPTEPSAASATPATSDDTPAGDDSSPDTGSAAIEIDAQDISWNIDTVTVKPGDTITVKNVGVLPHDFTIDALGIAETLDPGATVEITIPDDASGDYEYYCSVPGHAQAGMTGTLTVAP